MLDYHECAITTKDFLITECVMSLRSPTEDENGGISLHLQPNFRRLATEPDANMLFDEAWMLRLERLGYERARSTLPWDEIGSPYERPSPVESRSSQQ